MYTAYPNEESNDVVVVETKSSKLVAINNMIQYSKKSASDLFAGMGPGEKTQYSHKHANMKRKGGNRPPREYELTEVFCDFCRYVQLGQYGEALPLYYYLRHFSGG